MGHHRDCRCICTQRIVTSTFRVKVGTEYHIYIIYHPVCHCHFNPRLPPSLNRHTSSPQAESPQEEGYSLQLRCLKVDKDGNSIHEYIVQHVVCTYMHAFNYVCVSASCGQP